MAYNIPRSDPAKTTIVVTDNSVGISVPDTSLGLLGRNVQNYGTPSATNSVHLLENFANGTAPVDPVPGQLWFNNVDDTLNVNIGPNDGDNNWNVVGTGSGVGGPGEPEDNIWVTNVYAHNLHCDTSVFPGPCTISGDWVLTPGSTLQATYADLAERFSSDAFYEFGTVVKLGGEAEITATTTACDEDVFGVISNNPAFMMNQAAGDDITHPYVAFAGRVQVKVDGAISKGQRIVSSDIVGVAKVGQNNLTSFNVIGRALESSTDDGVKLVWVVVGAK